MREIRSAVLYNMSSAKMPLELKGGERWNHVFGGRILRQKKQLVCGSKEEECFWVRRAARS